LVENDIEFDIAIVDYNMRTQSKQEVEYAKELAKEYDKKIYVKDVLNIDDISNSNFEANARDIRYDFFDNIIEENSYDNLILAHQLNDKLEWFLMQFSKGAGLIELNGMQEITSRNDYTIIRPLLEMSKNELLNYLQINDIKYFEDSSNSDKKYKRNYFRHEFADRFLDEFGDGVKNSFKYIQKDYDSLMSKSSLIYHQKELYIYECDDENISMRIIDKQLKSWGYILSKAQKDEILNQKEIVIDKYAVSLIESDDKKRVWLSPYLVATLPKKFKEECRVRKIPPKHRGYAFSLDFSITLPSSTPG
jgi:tRNA(Ile)-lysidine synthase